MKYLAYTIIVIAVGLSIFNATQINLNAPFQGQSIVALITIMASLCAIVLMLILLTSKRIEDKIKHKN
jgi:uncharacterized membrane protein YhaH (DUF805 family)